MPLLVILGATAVGKTALAVELAEKLNGEIISADSRQIYRCMDIGTAKPSIEQKARIPHHLIDIVNPDEGFTLADFLDHARRAVEAIHNRGALAMLVGGTGQYITALLDGWTAPRVPPNPSLRADLEQYTALHGASALHGRLAAVDPQAAKTIDVNNTRRVIRALEVFMETGKPFSEQRKKIPPPYRVRVLGLAMARERLFARADSRLDQMMRDGFLEEVRSLLNQGYSRDLPSMSGLGYRQLAEHILGNITLEQAIIETRRATRIFIRHQDTWFRQHNHGTIWYNSESVSMADLIAQTHLWLDKRT